MERASMAVPGRIRHAVARSFVLLTTAGAAISAACAEGPTGRATVIAPGNTINHPEQQRPLSSLVAVYLAPGDTGNIADLTRARVAEYATGTLPGGVEFPLANSTSDSVRALNELSHNVVAKWLDPLTLDNSPTSPRFGSNCDYLAYFGNGWKSDWAGDVVGSAPQYNGNGAAGWLWSNFEYISNGRPSVGVAPTGQQLTLALYMQSAGLLGFDVNVGANWNQAAVDDYIRFLKTQIGGAWFRVAQNPQTGAWRVVRTPSAVRYDSTDNTLLALIGHQLTEPDHDDAGNILPDGVMVGVAGDCSGGQTPWGTVFSAEENVQDYYGDLEVAWNSNNGFVLGAGFDPGANVVPSVVPGNSGFYYGLLSNSFEKHNRDVYGYLVEIDPGQAPGLYYQSLSTGGDGKGHRKLGVMGRARWENAAFVVGSDWQLLDGKKIVIYGGDDRTSGRIYKWVSAAAYTTGMTKAQVRALLDEGTLYVCDFEDLNNNDGYTLLSTGLPPTEATRGTGRWVELSTTSTDIAPNAAALGDPTRTVGAALTDVNWNSIGGFPDDNTVRQALFTATNKIGAMELNRPEDVEWNALDPSGTPRLYVAFTNHTRRKALDQDGVLIPPAIHGTTPARADTVGRIFALEEANPASPQDSMTFTYFQVWGGSTGQGLFNAADPDNLMIDAAGGLWFGTDGNYGTNGRADAVYYVDLDPAHAAGQPGIVFPTFGLGFRVAAGPADSEATGPCFSSDMRTLFFNAQHPGESVSSTWPQDR